MAFNQVINNKVIRLVATFVLIILSLSSIYALSDDFERLSTLANQRYGQEAYKTVIELQGLTQRLQSASDIEKLTQINDFFNQKIQFVDDIEVWGISDYWATPLESIGHQAGDCEDFAIAKYVFLKKLNIDNNRLKLTYVRAQIQNGDTRAFRAHMVLSYYQTPQSEPLILDNLTPEILPASSRKDLSPIFSFNDTSLWLGSNHKPKAEAQSNLSRWRDVLSRIRANGIK